MRRVHERLIVKIVQVDLISLYLVDLPLSAARFLSSPVVHDVLVRVGYMTVAPTALLGIVT